MHGIQFKFLVILILLNFNHNLARAFVFAYLDKNLFHWPYQASVYRLGVHLSNFTSMYTTHIIKLKTIVSKKQVIKERPEININMCSLFWIVSFKLVAATS